MSKLPHGWATAPLGELARNLDSQRVPVNAKERAVRTGQVPYFGAAGQVGWIDRALFDEPLLLLGEDGVQFFDPDKRKAYMASGPSWVNNHAHVLGARAEVDLAYLMHYLNQFDYRGYANGTTRLKLTRAAMDRIPVALAPVAEQRRIVGAIEEAFSLLDAGETALHNTRTRLRRMRDSVLASAVTGQLVSQDPTDIPAAVWLASQGLGDAASADDRLPASWSRVRLGDVAEVKLGRQRSPARASGPRMRPYLRAANVGWNGLKLDDVKEMDFTASESAAFELVPGDLLLSEASGSPGEVGKPGQYRGQIEGCCFQNTLIRVRLRADWNPNFYEHYFRHQALAGEFAKGSRGVGIHHLGRTALSDWLTPVPPPEEQSRIVAEVERQFSFIEAAERAAEAALARSRGLRRSVLKAAFEGCLVEQDPEEEPASVLLERVAAERAVAAPARRAPRGARGKVERRE